jgi:hypothetical protein
MSNASTEVQGGTKPKADDGAQLGLIQGLVQAGGALLVVTIALFAVLLITLLLLTKVPEDQRATVITAAFTVIGTLVGAYTGAKIGASGLEDAQKSRDAEAKKVQDLAGKLHPNEYDAAMSRQ